jgi:hypothetical protein
MDTTQLTALISTLCTVIVLVGTISAKLIGGHTTKIVNEIVKNYLSELKPNHGSSLRDDVIHIRKDLVNLKVDVASLEGKFDQHIIETSK